MSYADLCRRSTAALAMVLLIACSSPEDRFADHVAKGAALGDAGEVEAAILEYRSALKIDSESAKANEQLASLLLRQGDLSATYYLSEAVRLDPARIDLAMRLTRVLLVSDQLDDAREMIQSALKLHPNSAPIYTTQAEFLLYMNDPEQALMAATKATELDPNDHAAWMQLGRVHEGRMRLADLKNEPLDKQIRRDGIAAFERADEIAGGSVAARIELARLTAMRKPSRKQAKEIFHSAVELAKEQGDALDHFAAAQAAEEFAIRTGRASMRIWALR